MKNCQEKLRRLNLTAKFMIRHFCILFGSMILGFILMVCVSRVSSVLENSPPIIQLLSFGISSVLVGTIFSAIFIRRPLKPIDHILDALTKISEGDYSVRLNMYGPPIVKKFNERFNHMASELGSVEMLREDFVNNFSHEFKTPIVSISGFAKMLKQKNLTAEERNEYLDIIINESARLAELATNVLNLSKIENQHILTDKKAVNISEQIRLAAVLLEKKWSRKNIDIQFDTHEVYLSGDEELLKQVWLNLIDNAVKFSPEYGEIKIEIQQSESSTTVSVSNEGQVSEDMLTHIFDKFYQEDDSRTQQGNGLGLPIAQKIIGLHGGTIEATNTDSGHIVFRSLFPEQ